MIMGSVVGLLLGGLAAAIVFFVTIGILMVTGQIGEEVCTDATNKKTGEVTEICEVTWP